VQRAQVHEVDETLLSAAGIERPPSPPLAHFARTMDVRIYGLSRVGS
jgi:hypothetical protein